MAVMAPPFPCGEHDLRQRLIDGDHEAFADLYRQFARSVYKAALRTAGDRHAAHDITQEVFLQAWAHPAGFDPERGSMRTWLGLLTQTAAIRWIRRREAETRKAQRQRSERYLAASPDEVAAASVTSELARHALDRLPPHQRRALELAYVQGLTYRQVASELGIPEGTAKSRMRLGLGHLARLMEA
ncbi:MAG TPA: sigma-70 family RNA polymerase sigma factor [Acidimicrobiales bacterium]|nr:sigma-70 family RNA polymerase sigma factor [Acidimicrobiales bacterium]